jgi:hypothetical protein
MKKTYIITVLIFVVAISKAQWVAVNNGLTNLNPMALTVSGTNLFAGTSGGGIFLSSNNGDNWTAVNNGVTDLNINTLAVSGSTIFAGSLAGGIFSSTNNGSNWTAVNTGLTDLNILAITNSGANIFAGTQNDGVFLSTNNGSNWTAVNTGLPTGPFPKISEFAVSGSTIFAGDGSMSGTCGVYSSTNNGSTWSTVNTGLTYLCVQSLAVNGPTVFTGNIGSLYTSTNGGGNWSAANSGLPASNYVSSMVVTGTTTFGGWSNGGVYVWNNNGNWADVSTGLPANKYIAALAVSGSTIFAGITGMGGVGVYKRLLSEVAGGIEEKYSGSNIAISPIPVSDFLKINFDGEGFEKEFTNVEIANYLGQTVYKKETTIVNKEALINTNDLVPGVYILNIKVNNSRISKRFIVAR